MVQLYCSDPIHYSPLVEDQGVLDDLHLEFIDMGVSGTIGPPQLRIFDININLGELGCQCKLLFLSGIVSGD